VKTLFWNLLKIIVDQTPDDDWLKIANKLINEAEIDYSPPINK